ncbi:MAG: aldehyde dehydrogenase family protein, partial [Actinobacteria bacterium]
MAVAAAPDVLESFSPTTGELLGSVPVTPPEAVQDVVDEVAQVQPFWAQLPLADRGRYLRRAAQAILDELDDIRDLIVREQGKTRVEAYLMELLPTVDALHWIADAGPRILADEDIPTPQIFFRGKRSAFAYEPLGVVGVIGPWN